MHPKSLVAGAAAALAVAAIDFATGYEILCSAFYFIPVSLYALGGRRAGLIMAAIAALLWGAADRANGHVYRYPLVAYWNIFEQFAGCAAVALLVAELKARRVNGGSAPSSPTVSKTAEIDDAAAHARAVMRRIEPDGTARKP